MSYGQNQGLMQGNGQDGRGAYGPPGGGGGYDQGGYGQPTGGGGGYDQGGYGQPTGGGYGQGGAAGGPYGQPTGGGGDGYGNQDYTGYGNGGQQQGYGQPQTGGYGGGGGGGMKEGNRQWKNGWFGAGFLMMVMGIFGFVECFFSGQMIDSIEFFYLFVFCAVIVIDNMPFMKDAVRNFRGSIGIYVQALRRMTFLGLFLIFIGSSLIGAFTNNDTGGFLTVLGGLAGGVGVLVGLVSMIFGVRNSMQLEKLRKQFEGDANIQRLDQEFGKYSQNRQFLNPQDFVDMCGNRGILWDPHYNQLIFNALCFDNPNRDSLSHQAFMEWVRGVPACLPTLL